MKVVKLLKEGKNINRQILTKHLYYFNNIILKIKILERTKKSCPSQHHVKIILNIVII